MICFIFFATFSIAGAEEGVPCASYPLCASCPLIDGKPVCTRCHNMYGLTDASYPDNPCQDCRNFTGCQLCTTIRKCDNCTLASEGPDDDGIATCSPCPDNCKSCRSSSKTCDTCKEGFVLKDGQCLSCPSSCRQCTDQLACIYCNKGFYENKEEKSCKACLTNCDACSDDKTCLRCATGFYPSSDNAECIECTMQNCMTCTYGNTCAVCNDGYYLQNPTKCTSCPSNCQICGNNGKCSRCKNGKVSADGSCECASNCSSCHNNGWGKCDTCQKGYKRNADKTCDPIDD